MRNASSASLYELLTGTMIRPSLKHATWAITKSSEFSPEIRIRSPGIRPELARFDAVLEVKSKKVPRSTSRPSKENSLRSSSTSKLFFQDPTRVSPSGICKSWPDMTS